jgi:hypothetical protein
MGATLCTGNIHAKETNRVLIGPFQKVDTPRVIPVVLFAHNRMSLTESAARSAPKGVSQPLALKRHTPFQPGLASHALPSPVHTVNSI